MRANRLMALGLVILLGCARDPSRIQNAAQVNAPLSGTDEREAEMGKQIHQAIVSSFRIYTEPRLVNYIREIGESLAQAADRRNLNYQFTVLYDDRAYATEAPGGYVYITTGFLYFLQNEAELAGVLAHEIANLQFLDPRFSLVRQAAEKVTHTTALLAPLLGQIGVLAAMAVILLQAVTNPDMPEGEAKLLIADEKALRYLVKAGYDPQGYLDLHTQLLNLKPEWKPYFYDYLYSRPLSPERYQAILERFEKLPLEGKHFDVNREHYLEITHGIREIYQR